MTDDYDDAQALREHLGPLCRAGLRDAAEYNWPDLAEACQWLQRTLDARAPCRDVVAAVMMVAHHLGRLEARRQRPSIHLRHPSTAEWFAALTEAAKATMNRTGPKPISVGLVGKLVGEGFKGDGLMLELRDRTGKSERTARRAIAAWRVLQKADGVICIIELNEDGRIVVTFPPQGEVSS
jgi:hypothetical protein